MQITKGKLTKPRRCLLYGPKGIGKSTCAKNSFLMDLEGGSNDIEVANRADLSQVDYQGFLAALGELFEMDIEESTIAIDSADWLENLMKQDICRSAGEPSINEGKLGFGVGKGRLEQHWEYVRRGLEKLREAKGKNILLLCHDKQQAVRPSDSVSFEQIAPDLDVSLIADWADEVLAYRYRNVTTEEKTGFGNKRNVAVNTKLRYIQCDGTLGCLAKQRCGIRSEIESWEEYAVFLAK